MSQTEKIDKVYQLETYIKSDKFDVEDMSYYQLCLSVSNEHFRFCAVNSLDHTCLILQDFRFFARQSEDELLNTLNRIFDNDMFLKANFWKSINIIQKGQPYTLVPSKFFEETAPERYLKPIAVKTDKLAITTQEHPEFEMVSISYIDKKLQNWLRTTYPTRDIKYVHQTDAFLKGITLQKRPQSQSSSVHIFVENSYFLMTVIGKEGGLEFSNAFSYRHANDFIYYILFVLDELRLSKDTTPLFVYGNLNPVSEIFKNLQIYFGEVALVTKNPNWLRFEYLFDEVSNYHYFDLYGLYAWSESL